MGLLKHLLFWPVTGPTFLTRFSLEKVRDSMREELTSDESVKEELLALQMRLEVGEIDEAEYLDEEAKLMLRFREVRRWREEFGMSTRGGAVRVAGPPPGEAEASGGGDGGVVDIASGEGASVEVHLDEEER